MTMPLGSGAVPSTAIVAATPSRPAAPAMLGSLAASLQALEIYKLLRDGRTALAGQELYLNQETCEPTRTLLRRNPRCRFDHVRWHVHPASAASLADLCCRAREVGERSRPQAEPASIFVPGHVFARTLVCGGCDASHDVLHLSRRLTRAQATCDRCGGRLEPLGLTTADRIDPRTLPPSMLAEPLARLGLVDGDVVAVTDCGGARRYLRLCTRTGERENGNEPRVAVAGTRRVVIVGCGNIGSHLVALLARCGLVDAMLLVDPDRYETRNLASQDIGPQDIGRAKVDVQAARVASIAPELAVETAACAFEDMPVGTLENAVVATCLDSRIARLHVGRAAWRLDAPVVDAAVSTDALLARVTVQLARSNADRTRGDDTDPPCLECDWEDDDYVALEQVYPCNRDKSLDGNRDQPLGGGRRTTEDSHDESGR